MKYRILGRTGWKVSEISFGAWAIGGAWGTVDDKESLAQFALRWILEHPAVTCAIPGARRPSQVTENIAASDLPPLSEAMLDWTV